MTNLNLAPFISERVVVNMKHASPISGGRIGDISDTVLTLLIPHQAPLRLPFDDIETIHLVQSGRTLDRSRPPWGAAKDSQ